MSCLSSNPGYKLEGNTRGWIGWHFKGSGSGRARGVPRLGIGIGEEIRGRVERGLPGGRALGVGAWKIKGYCATFPRRSHPSFPHHCLPRAHIFPEKCLSHAHQGSCPQPHILPLSVSQLCAPTHCSPAWPHPQPQEGELATAQWGVQAAVGPVASSPCSRGFSFQVSSRFLCLCGPNPGMLSRFP